MKKTSRKVLRHEASRNFHHSFGGNLEKLIILTMKKTPNTYSMAVVVINENNVSYTYPVFVSFFPTLYQTDYITCLLLMNKTCKGQYHLLLAQNTRML